MTTPIAMPVIVIMMQFYPGAGTAVPVPRQGNSQVMSTFFTMRTAIATGIPEATGMIILRGIQERKDNRLYIPRGQAALFAGWDPRRTARPQGRRQALYRAAGRSASGA